MVVVEPGDRIHFLDWGGPGRRHAGPDPADPRPVEHGLDLGSRSPSPAPERRVIAMDLRGHGLSDAPTEAYTPDVLAEDVVAVAEGSGLLAAAGRPGGPGGAWVRRDRGGVGGRGPRDRCAGLVLVDGGWEDLEAATGMDADEFLRGLDEPPEVMRSLDAFLADRAAFDPATWDADQDRAARATVVETHAGRVVPATRPHALEACVRTMFEYDPGEPGRSSRRRSSRSSPTTTRRARAAAPWRARVTPARPRAARRSGSCRSGETGTT